MELQALHVQDAGEDGFDHPEGFQLLRRGLHLADPRLRLRFRLRFIPLTRERGLEPLVDPVVDELSEGDTGEVPRRTGMIGRRLKYRDLAADNGRSAVAR